MKYIEIILLALALAADAFGVGASLGLKYKSFRQIFRISFHFGLFQGLFPLAGALCGTLILKYVQAWDHWIAFIILSGLGLRMIIESRKQENRVEKPIDLTRGVYMVGLSTAVSIDAFAAGVTIPASGDPLILSVVIIALVAGLATVIAMKFACAVQQRFGSKIDIVAGFVLIGLGLKILLTHILGA